ncbi:MAG: hypothetical protein LT070_02630 [Solirubrobacteraceae bacterium]|nr:hypothetical protein [Solirubrobacteraceae bacterium]
MSTMEYRAWIDITGFPTADDEAAWLPFADALDRQNADVGAVLSWSDRHTAQVVMSANVDDRAQFARTAIVRVTEALEAADMPDLYPTAIEIEPADEPALV